ncbi:MAG: efflux RND transporter periplasmic adaptor subunit [Thermoanaerobaculia bacterium]|jgi:HlyD family secretion protein|nr:efflux RND transporter periplasmic adaptor subunit [Thermoanaerobaculia bacterium]
MNRDLRCFAAAVFLPLLLAGCREAGDGAATRLNGRIEAPVVDLAPKVSGRVLEVKVREGDRVKAGDLLVTLDLGEIALSVERDRDALGSASARLRDLQSGSRSQEVAAAEADLADKKAALELARKELARQEALMAKKVGIPRDLDRARTELERTIAARSASAERLALAREGFRRFQTEGARADVRRAETILKQSETIVREAEILAPADGVVLHRMAEPGLLLGAGQPALTLAFADRLYVRTFVPETRLGRVRPGLAAQVFVDAFPGRSFPARVTEISPTAEFTPKAVETREERVNLVYAAKVDLDAGWDAPLVPGQPAEVVVETDGEAPTVTTKPPAVPSASLR